MPARFPELTPDGLVLWRLQQNRDHQLCCYVTEFCGEITLSIHDLDTGEVPIAETHFDVSTLVHRTEQLRRDFLTTGWLPFELDEEDQRLPEDS